MTVTCVECSGAIDQGEYHRVLPSRPTDLHPRRVHYACHELAHHLASTARSGRPIEPGELRREWARMRASDELRSSDFAEAQARARVIASRLHAFKGPRAASEWA